MTATVQQVTKHQELSGQYRNTIVDAINKDISWPKGIILIFENDVLNALNHFKPGVSLLSGRCLEWLANQLHRMVVSQKEKLPSKARKFKYPTILWTLLPLHSSWSRAISEARGKFNNCIKNTVSLFREMDTLEIEDWDTSDMKLLNKNKMTATGLNNFWIGLDRAFQSWDKNQMQSRLQGRISIPVTSERG